MLIDVLLFYFITFLHKSKSKYLPKNLRDDASKLMFFDPLPSEDVTFSSFRIKINLVDFFLRDKSKILRRRAIRNLCWLMNSEKKMEIFSIKSETR